MNYSSNQPQSFKVEGASITVQHHELLQQQESLLMRDLAHRWNTLAPVSSLPAELLVRIFLALVQASKHCLQWIAVTHVSHQWRSLALSCPALWCHIPISKPRWAREMILRSKSTPLLVQAHALDVRLSASLLVELLADLSRIEGMDIKSDWFDNIAVEPTSAPLLKHLCLIQRASGVIGVEKFFEQYLPSLRSLHLDHVDLQWGSLRCPNLVRMTLKNVDFYNDPNPSRLVEILVGCPLLQSLELEDLDLPNDLPSEQISISLPFLKKLAIRGELNICVRTMDQIKSLSVADFSLVCRPHGSELSTLSRLLVPRLLKAGEMGLPIHKLSILVSSDHLNILGWTTDCTARGGQHCVEASFSAEDSPRGRVYDFAEFRKFIPDHTIEAVEVRGIWVSGFFWVSLSELGPLPNLHTLTVTPEWIEAVTDSLGSFSTLFPVLKRLIISDSDFGEWGLRRLYDTLAEYKMSGGTLEEVELRACVNVDERYAERLREHVRTVSLVTDSAST